MGSLGSELGVVDAGVFLGVRNPLNVSASRVNTFFLGDVVLLEVVFGVALLPSSVTSPSVGPEFDSGDTGAWVGDVPEPDGVCGVPEPDGVCDVPEPDGVCGVPEPDGVAVSWPEVCGGAGSVAPALGGSVFISDSCGS